ncbi:NAD-binding protein [Mycobacterium sp. CVI_P3]|uniref:NAD-binding protein n=1 Tax=Mycobacterium pinniadriaticum TaxID=2994102 RepID=A0ABT3SNZ0_9MYCO|nr:NAD-binding protein [Mycobacterium pinniadriaticum]MCX2934830.1 NAD-binding protein [Mycobacterium pinniadriaticum]MCX2941253.1 NAD-binding protein [Mycobacterium pinniadriaticum]
MLGHTIVCGDDALGLRIIDELNNAGISVAISQTPEDLHAAGIATAEAVICADDDDALNLEIALLARQANPNVRVVARLANAVLREAMAANNGPGAILDVADLAAPSVVEALLKRRTHTISVAGVDFMVSGTTAASDGTLREMYGDLAPVAIIRSETSDTPGEVIACPGRDIRIHPGDRTAMIGTAHELTEQGIEPAKPISSARRERPMLIRPLDVLRAFRDDLNPMFYRALGASLTLLIGSTIMLRFAYKQPGMGWVDALYFSAETIATVGYGDFNFLEQPTWLRLWGIVMMFAGVATTAIVVALIADVLLSRRLAQATNRQKVRHLHRHIVVVGLGSFGIQVAAVLKAAGHDVAVIERNEDNRYLSAAAELGLPVIFGDATLRQTLEAARIDEARAIAVLTQDDMVNIETGIVLREMLGPGTVPGAQRPDIPIVLRIYDRALGSAVGKRFKFEYVRSTVDLATPWFIGAAMGLDVLGTFSVGQRSFMVGGVQVQPGSELDGIRMFELSTQTRVIAIGRDAAPLRLHPRRDTQLVAGDTAYLVGPYRELLDTLRKGKSATVPNTVSGPTRTG